MSRPGSACVFALALMLTACGGVVGGTDAGDEPGQPRTDAGVDDAGVPDAGPQCPAFCPEATPVCDAAQGECVECLAQTDCPATRPVCDTARNACAVCLGNADCPAETPLCDTSVEGGRCVTCLSDADCAEPSPFCEPTRHSCVGEAGACAFAKPLTIASGGTVDFTVDLSQAHDQTFGSCSDTTGPGNGELVYRITLTEPQDLIVHAQATEGSEADPVLYARTASCSGEERGCVDTAGTSDTLWLFNQPAGDYFVFVEAFRGTGGPVDVQVSLAPPSMTPGNDTCAAPAVLAFTGDVATFTANTVLANDDEVGSCNPVGQSPEVLYQFELTAPKKVVVSAIAMGDVQPALYVRSDLCSNGNEAQCSVATANAGSLTVPMLPAGTYFLAVETVGEGGMVSGTVTLQEPGVGESCSSPSPLSISPGGSTAFTVDTSTAENDEVGGCEGSSSAGLYPELVYQLTLTQAQDLKVTATPSSGSSADPAVYVRSGDCETGNELACVDSYSSYGETVDLLNLQPGTYFIFIETYSTHVGAVDVTVDLSGPTLPAPGESCGAPVPITFASGSNTATFSLDTTGAADDHAGSCSYSGGADLVYSLTLTQTQTVTVTAVPPTGAWTDVSLYARSGSCSGSASTELACVDSAWDGGTEVMTLTSLPAGTYYLFFETYSGYEGPMDVTVTLSP